jgi:DUF971 family protein
LELGASLGFWNLDFGASGRLTTLRLAAAQALLSVRKFASLPEVRLEPTNIQQIGNELAIQWNDGTESYLDLQFLRRACPCAACGGEPDVLGNILRPNVSYSDNSFELAGFEIVGGYAIQPRWADGHNTGIYSFQYLRRLSHPVTTQ